MLVVWLGLCFVAEVIGLLGCVVPVLPGPILSYLGLFCLLLTDSKPSFEALIGFGLVTAVVTILDYVVPLWGAKKFQSSTWGLWGCFVGTIVGLFFLPIGLVAGPFLGAVVGEVIAGRDNRAAVRSGFGALLGFLAGTLVKFILCLALLGYTLGLVW